MWDRVTVDPGRWIAERSTPAAAMSAVVFLVRLPGWPGWRLRLFHDPDAGRVLVSLQWRCRTVWIAGYVTAGEA